MDALKFPPHFPPTGRWKQFFLGVRWLGPDLAFFKELQRGQANREQALLGQWGGGQRQRIAEAISRVLAQQLSWKSQVFLPEDSVMVCFHGPSFNSCDSEEAFEAVVEALQKEFDIETFAQRDERRQNEAFFERKTRSLCGINKRFERKNNKVMCTGEVSRWLLV